MTIHPIILAGGSGTRLWPASRQSHPKQLLALAGPYSFLQDTALRLQGLPAISPAAGPIVVTNEDYRFLVADQLRKIGVD
ncbi:MAG: mannose-1-phosphate guanylyltransferase/mannose-6-phosphate isomerase, partial [Armatimonadetes bacterium]|nr:mannose-1-phosphate guanylyltransferase/mannose-6-phosphate isomerase [Armatimonadota bacterium]